MALMLMPADEPPERLYAVIQVSNSSSEMSGYSSSTAAFVFSPDRIDAATSRLRRDPQRWFFDLVKTKAPVEAQ